MKIGDRERKFFDSEESFETYIRELNYQDIEYEIIHRPGGRGKGYYVIKYFM